jgi:hypothetical protein
MIRNTPDANGTASTDSDMVAGLDATNAFPQQEEVFPTGFRFKDAMPVLAIAADLARERRGDPNALDRNGFPLWLQYVAEALASANIGR